MMAAGRRGIGGARPRGAALSAGARRKAPRAGRGAGGRAPQSQAPGPTEEDATAPPAQLGGDGLQTGLSPPAAEREVPLAEVSAAVREGRESGFIFKPGEVEGAGGGGEDDWMDEHLAERFGPMPGFAPGDEDDFAGAPMPRGPPLSAYTEEGGFVDMTPEDLHSHCSGESCEWETGSVVVADIRTPTEYAAGHIPGAVSLPFEDLSDLVRAGRLDDFRQNGRVVVCCATGQRSAQATVRLSQVFKFEDVVSLRGGVFGWQQRGFPIHAPSQSGE